MPRRYTGRIGDVRGAVRVVGKRSEREILPCECPGAEGGCVPDRDVARAFGRRIDIHSEGRLSVQDAGGGGSATGRLPGRRHGRTFLGARRSMSEASRPATIEDLKLLAASLNESGVEYLLIGGYALAAHLIPSRNDHRTRRRAGAHGQSRGIAAYQTGYAREGHRGSCRSRGGAALGSESRSGFRTLTPSQIPCI